MAVWSLLIGVRKDVRLRTKWWHHLAIGGAVLSGLIVYLTVGTFVQTRPVPWTPENTYSLTLLNHAAGRQTTTTIADLDKLAGIVAAASAEDGRIVPLPRNGVDTIRCENTAKFKANDTLSVGGVSYRSIADYANQPAGELRHCVAAPLYAGFNAASVAVYIPDGTARRKQTVKGILAGVGAVLAWLILYWNVYYRVLVPIYVRRREVRRRRRFEQYSVR